MILGVHQRAGSFRVWDVGWASRCNMVSWKLVFATDGGHRSKSSILRWAGFDGFWFLGGVGVVCRTGTLPFSRGPAFGKACWTSLPKRPAKRSNRDPPCVFAPDRSASDRSSSVMRFSRSSGRRCATRCTQTCGCLFWACGCQVWKPCAAQTASLFRGMVEGGRWVTNGDRLVFGFGSFAFLRSRF